MDGALTSEPGMALCWTRVQWDRACYVGSVVQKRRARARAALRAVEERMCARYRRNETRQGAWRTDIGVTWALHRDVLLVGIVRYGAAPTNGAASAGDRA